jgi:Tfp pilus assembly protein PilO
VNISKRDKKFLTVGALALLLFLVINYIIIPFIESEQDIREGTEQKEVTLERYERIIGERTEVEKQLAQVKKKQAQLNAKLLTGSTPSLAAADMQKMLEKIAGTHDLEMKSVKVQDGEKQGDLLTIPLEIRLQTDLERTRKFLADIEKNQKYLTVPSLKISVQNQRDPKEIIVTMVVTGFFMKEEEVKEEKG